MRLGVRAGWAISRAKSVSNRFRTTPGTFAIFLLGKAHSSPLAPCSAFLRYLMCGLRGTAGGLEGRGWEEGAESGFECQEHPPVTMTTISTPCAPSSILGIGRKEAWVSLLFHLSSSGKGGSNPCG